MVKTWSDDAWDDYLYWHEQGNKSNIKKINKLIKDIDRSPFAGLGKPEPLKYDLSGKWLRRITDEHRLIYKVENETIFIYSEKDHY